MKGIKTPGRQASKGDVAIRRGRRGMRQKRVELRENFWKLGPGMVEAVAHLSGQLQYYVSLALRDVNPRMTAGTTPELIVYGWLVAHGFTPNRDFTFQSSEMGGRMELGGAVADFKIFNRQPPLIIRVQGTFFHTQSGRRASDEAQALGLLAQGYRVVDLFEERIKIESVLENEMRLALGVSV